MGLGWCGAKLCVIIELRECANVRIMSVTLAQSLGRLRHLESCIHQAHPMASSFSISNVPLQLLFKQYSLHEEYRMSYSLPHACINPIGGQGGSSQLRVFPVPSTGPSYY